jgi:hypothetical protein
MTFTLLFTSCNFTIKGAQKYQISDRERAVNQAMERNTKILSEKYKMHPFGITVAMPGGNIQYLELAFQICGPLSQDFIRKKLIDAAHDFLADINSDQKLCLYLKNNCFNIYQIGITLFLIDSNGMPIRDPEIGIASIEKGKLIYDKKAEKYDDYLKRNISFYSSSYTESYEKALKILNSQPYH